MEQSNKLYGKKLVIKHVREKNLRTYDLQTYCLLLDFRGNKTYCYPSQKYLEEEYGVCHKAFSRSCKRLESFGLLLRVACANKKRGRPRHNYYFPTEPFHKGICQSYHQVIESEPEEQEPEEEKEQSAADFIPSVEMEIGSFTEPEIKPELQTVEPVKQNTCKVVSAYRESQTEELSNEDFIESVKRKRLSKHLSPECKFGA